MLDLPLGPSFVQVGRSDAPDALSAVKEAAAQLRVTDSCFVLAFVPDTLNVEVVVAALDAVMQGTPVFGCTTAGQSTEDGYESEALLLLGFPRTNFRCASILFENIRPLSATQVASQAQRFVEKFQHTARWNRLALLLADGLSKQEDLLVSTLESVLSDLPIFGGSAGDGLRFEQTFVLHEGRAHCNAAVLLLIETNLEFQGVGFDHFLPVGTPIIITDANPNERLGYEINGTPAALEYARLVGCNVGDLSPEVFAENPMLLQHHSNHYVRAINDATVYRYDPAIPEFAEMPVDKVDLVICTDVMEHIPEDDVDALFATIRSLSKHAFFNISVREAKEILPNGENAHCTVQPPPWWRQRLLKQFRIVRRTRSPDPTAVSFLTWPEAKG